MLNDAAAARKIRDDLSPGDLLRAVANLCVPSKQDGAGHNQRMIALLHDGLRYGARSQKPPRK